MLRSKTVILSILITICLTTRSTPASERTAPKVQAAKASGLDQVVSRIVARERNIAETMRNYNPVIETYMQRLEFEDDVLTPKEDAYLLGKLDWKKGIKTQSLIFRNGYMSTPLFGSLSKPLPFHSDRIQEVYAGLSLVDQDRFDEKHYRFRYIRQEFLGEMRCLVFEVSPENKVRDAFSGRIWVEDKDYTIVRFNGVNSARKELHFDSWRMNLRPGQWLPAYIYTEDSDQRSGVLKRKPVRVKAQTRLWGYSLKGAARQDEFTAVLVDESAVRDQSASDKQVSPVWNQRAWERQAEDNVLERLEAASLLAPDGEVDKVLKTVVTNLEITNNLEITPEVRCRVLLTSPLETFIVGHTIVLSRGLIDVLPDEGSLAAMLAHEMGHILLGHQPIDTKYAFSDRMLVSDRELLERFRFGRKAAEESAADLKAMELLKNSPYKDKLANAGLFLKTLATLAKQLPALIQSHMGDAIARDEENLRLSDLMNSAPELEMGRLDQITALPLGGRVEMDPWNGRLQLLKSRPAALVAAREKMPLEVTPFMPYLVYAQAAANGPIVNTSQKFR